MDPFPLTGGYGAVAWLRARARELGEAAVPDLEVVVRDGSLELRAAALLALAEIAPARSEALVLERAQHDPEREVREAATRALGHGSGSASLAYLRDDSSEDRAARIALKARCQSWSNIALEEVVVAAIDGGSADDRFASVCLDVLAERRSGNAQVVLDVMRRRPGFISARAAEGLGAGVGTDRQDELLDLIAQCTDPEQAPVLGSMARYAEPARVFERLAPVVRGGPPALAKAIVASPSEQASASWTSADGPGFDDGASPVGPMPDERWYEVLTHYVPLDDGEPHHDFDLGLAALKDSLVWTYRERERATRGFRYVDSGAEEGAAFVVAGFDLGSQTESRRSSCGSPTSARVA